VTSCSSQPEVTGPLRTCWPESQSDPSFRWPATVGGLRIAPQRLAHNRVAARLLLPQAVDLADVLEADVVAGEEAAVQDEVADRAVGTELRLERQPRVLALARRLRRGDEVADRQRAEDLLEELDLVSRCRGSVAHLEGQLRVLLLGLALEAVNLVPDRSVKALAVRKRRERSQNHSRRQQTTPAPTHMSLVS